MMIRGHGLLRFTLYFRNRAFACYGGTMRRVVVVYCFKMTRGLVTKTNVCLDKRVEYALKCIVRRANKSNNLQWKLD